MYAFDPGKIIAEPKRTMRMNPKTFGNLASGPHLGPLPEGEEVASDATS